MLDTNSVVIARNAQRTSIAAAQKVLPKTGSLRRKVYEYILNQGLHGATDQEMELSLKIDGNTIRPTRISLLKDGFILDTGTTRKNQHGNDCIVWRSAEEGMLL
jgi:transcription initiation factor IIE alpha subunit